MKLSRLMNRLIEIRRKAGGDAIVELMVEGPDCQSQAILTDVVVGERMGKPYVVFIHEPEPEFRDDG